MYNIFFNICSLSITSKLRAIRCSCIVEPAPAMDVAPSSDSSPLLLTKCSKLNRFLKKKKMLVTWYAL